MHTAAIICLTASTVLPAIYFAAAPRLSPTRALILSAFLQSLLFGLIGFATITALAHVAAN